MKLYLLKEQRVQRVQKKSLKAQWKHPQPKPFQIVTTIHIAPTEPTLRETSLTTVYQREEQSEEPSETRLRFINVANGYQPVEIYVNNKQFANYIGYGEATEYKNIQGEEIQVSLLGENGYIYLQRSVTVTAGKVISVAIINTGFGYGFVVVPEKR